MGANQSTARHSEAGTSRGFTCCGHRDDEDDFADIPEKHLRISKGQVQPAKSGRKSPFRSPLWTPEPLTPGQPAMRSKMSLPLGGRRDSQDGEPTRYGDEQYKQSDRPLSRSDVFAKKFGTKPSVTFQESRPAEPSPNPERLKKEEAPKLELPLLGLGVGDMLPQSKRLSPMPDFTSLQSQEMKKIAAAEPWLVVRNIAEKTPSRRSSIFEPSLSPRTNESKSVPSRSLRSPPKSPTSTVSPVKQGRSRAHTAGERRRPDFANEPLPTSNFNFGPHSDHQRGPSTALRLQTDFGNDHRPKPSLISDASTLVGTDAGKGSVPSTRPGSPQRKRSKISRIRKDSAPAQLGDTSVEDAVRELEQIVQSKRDPRDPRDPDTPSSAASQSARSDRKLHRPAIAPNMVMKDVSSELLDEIGSGLSRRLSEGTGLCFLKNENDNSTTSSLPLETISKQRLSRRESSWPGTVTTEGTTPRHSGTFFFSRKSLDEIMSPQSSSTVKSPFKRLERDTESPVDRQWSDERIPKPAAAKLASTQAPARSAPRLDALPADKPLPANPPPTTPVSEYLRAEPHSPTTGNTFVTFHRPNLSAASQATATTSFSVNSNLFPSPTTPVPDMPPVPTSKKFPKPPQSGPQTSPQDSQAMNISHSKRSLRNDDSTPSQTPSGRRPSYGNSSNSTSHRERATSRTDKSTTASGAQRERLQSRGDQSNAVLAARKRAADKIAEDEAAGMGLGIGGMLSAKDLANVVEMDVWNAKAAHEHPSRSRANSVATHKTDSVLVEPSMSPLVATEGIGGLNEGVERAMSVQVPKGHVAHLVRTQSGKSVTKTTTSKSRQSSVDHKKKDERERHRPLAGAPRNPSKESNTLPGTSAPAQNEARQRKDPNAANVQSQLLQYQQQYHAQQEAARQVPPPRPRRPSQPHAVTPTKQQPQAPDRPGAVSPRNRSGSAAGRAQGVEFGLDLQRSASARRLREVEAQIAQMEKQKQQNQEDTVPPLPSSIKGIAGKPKSGPYTQGNGVRASQVGMAL